MSLNASEQYLNEWKDRQNLAEKMIPLVGQLYRDRGLVILMYGRRLMNATTIDILKAHRYVRQMAGIELDVNKSFEMLETIASMDLSPARLDLGKLCSAYLDPANDLDMAAFLTQELAAINTGKKNPLAEPQDVVLYGFGRIGRLLARLLIERTGAGNKMRLRAIVVRGGREGDLKKRASLLRRDSVHGPFNGSIIIDEETNAIIANGNYIKVIYADSPDSIDYTQYGIHNALIVDNTGIWKDEAGLGLHLKSKGTSKVILTAPAKGDIKNIVYGVNHNEISADDKILCAAS
jgi:glyceraldehyde 3-phosphate dehydrogenase